MAGERRAVRSGGTTVAAALELVVGVLLAVGHPGRPAFLVLGVGLALASLVLLVVSARRWRRERAAAAIRASAAESASASAAVAPRGG